MTDESSTSIVDESSSSFVGHARFSFFPKGSSSVFSHSLGVLEKKWTRFVAKARDAFLPSAESVTEDYWEYARFRFYQRAASSCITVFATQQMLQAIGLGATRRLPAAAAVNWVLKDGLGRLGKLSVATNFGREFDSDVKRFRFTSSVVYDCASLVEMLTPFYPKRFLLLATVANVGKSVGITTANVVRAPIQRSFALEENLAEITAKTSAQQVLADNLGLAAAVVATSLTGKIASAKARLILPLLAFVPLATADLYCIYRELKATQLKTINRERGEIVAELFVKNGDVPSFKTVADAERLFIPARAGREHAASARHGPRRGVPHRAHARGRAAGRPDDAVRARLPLPERDEAEKTLAARAGVALADVVAKTSAAFSSKTKTKTNDSRSADTKKKKQKERMKGHATLALATHATSRDVMQAVLQVAHPRALPFRKDLDKEAAREWALGESRASRARRRRVRRAAFSKRVARREGAAELRGARAVPGGGRGRARARAYARNGNESGGRGGVKGTSPEQPRFIKSSYLPSRRFLRFPLFPPRIPALAASRLAAAARPAATRARASRSAALRA